MASTGSGDGWRNEGGLGAVTGDDWRNEGGLGAVTTSLSAVGVAVGSTNERCTFVLF